MAEPAHDKGPQRPTRLPAYRSPHIWRVVAVTLGLAVLLGAIGFVLGGWSQF